MKALLIATALFLTTPALAQESDGEGGESTPGESTPEPSEPSPNQDVSPGGDYPRESGSGDLCGTAEWTKFIPFCWF